MVMTAPVRIRRIQGAPRGPWWWMCYLCERGCGHASWHAAASTALGHLQILHHANDLRQPDHQTLEGGGMVSDNRFWPTRKLTSRQKTEIHDRYQAGENSWDLAGEFGVTASAIRRYGGARSPGHPGGQGYTSSGMWREQNLDETGPSTPTK